MRLRVTLGEVAGFRRCLPLTAWGLHKPAHANPEVLVRLYPARDWGTYEGTATDRSLCY